VASPSIFQRPSNSATSSALRRNSPKPDALRLAGFLALDLFFIDCESLGRPWITLAIDVASRIVMGMFISFDAPSITSVCLSLTHACLPKNRWLTERKIDVEWDQWGIPAALHKDNAREFHSQSVRRGCDEYGIKKIFRPIARPHFGGHIERLIGTLMGRVHLLPGTTSSSIAAAEAIADGTECIDCARLDAMNVRRLSDAA
jgi:putative transposase